MNGDFNYNTRINNLIFKFPDRQTTTEEEEKLWPWVSQSEGNRGYYNGIQFLFNTIAKQDLTPFDREVAFLRFKARISVQQTVKNNSRYFNLYTSLRWVAISLVALLLGGIVFSVYDNYFISSDKNRHLISEPDGAKVKIKLPDKSMVLSIASSTLGNDQYLGQKGFGKSAGYKIRF